MYDHSEYEWDSTLLHFISLLVKSLQPSIHVKFLNLSNTLESWGAGGTWIVLEKYQFIRAFLILGWLGGSFKELVQWMQLDCFGREGWSECKCHLLSELKVEAEKSVLPLMSLTHFFSFVGNPENCISAAIVSFANNQGNSASTLESSIIESSIATILLVAWLEMRINLYDIVWCS
jgi:hypothetical protein